MKSVFPFSVAVSLLLFSFLLTNCDNREIASLVLTNGKVITVDGNFSIHEAVAVKGSRIISVGSNQDINRYINQSTKVIDLQGKTVLPGLIDTQGHMLQLGNALTYLDIHSTTSYEEIVKIVKERVKITPPGAWIIGGRWDQNKWEIKDFPNHSELSKISPENPVFLLRVDGYAALVNEKAMNLSGISPDTKTPFGGSIIHDKYNNPTGVLINRAMTIVKNIIPGETDQAFKEKVRKGIRNCLKNGLTSWHEIGISPYHVSLIKQLIDDNQLDMRTVTFLGEQEDPVLEVDLENYFAQFKIDNYGDNFLSVKGIQLHFDGALGSRGAALFSPYNDDRDNIGLIRIPPDYIYRMASAALKLKMVLNTSCIGTRGNQLCLDEYEKALKKNPVKDHRLRITHAQVLLEKDIPRFKKLGVIPAMQPIHATSDMGFAEARIGSDRIKGAYAWRSILNTGSKIACGSDFPVETNDPFASMYAAITRKDVSGNPPNGWYSEQCMTLEEVIKGYTIWAAYSVFQDNILGSIEVGKLADFTIINKYLLAIPPEELLDTKVMYTIVGGVIKYSSEQ
ncbi:MAG: amidohydrolase [Bacteroidetes bacterium]|nr:amidohydrolase [Bacteroidota bacterium]